MAAEESAKRSNQKPASLLITLNSLLNWIKPYNILNLHLLLIILALGFLPYANSGRSRSRIRIGGNRRRPTTSINRNRNRNVGLGVAVGVGLGLAATRRNNLRYGRHGWSACRNYQNTNETGGPQGIFTCPMYHQSYSYKYCCGPSNAQYCCSFGSGTGRVGGVVAGILAVLGVIGIAYCFYKSKRKSSQNGREDLSLKQTQPRQSGQQAGSRQPPVGGVHVGYPSGPPRPQYGGVPQAQYGGFPQAQYGGGRFPSPQGYPTGPGSGPYGPPGQMGYPGGPFRPPGNQTGGSPYHGQTQYAPMAPSFNPQKANPQQAIPLPYPSSSPEPSSNPPPYPTTDSMPQPSMPKPT